MKFNNRGEITTVMAVVMAAMLALGLIYGKKIRMMSMCGMGKKHDKHTQHDKQIKKSTDTVSGMETDASTPAIKKEITAPAGGHQH